MNRLTFFFDFCQFSLDYTTVIVGTFNGALRVMRAVDKGMRSCACTSGRQGCTRLSSYPDVAFNWTLFERGHDVAL